MTAAEKSTAERVISDGDSLGGEGSNGVGLVSVPVSVPALVGGEAAGGFPELRALLGAALDCIVARRLGRIKHREILLEAALAWLALSPDQVAPRVGDPHESHRRRPDSHVHQVLSSLQNDLRLHRSRW